MTTGTWINYLIKQTVGRQRPLSHLNIDSGLSFPSGHSNASTLFFIIIVIVVIPMLKGKIAQILVATISTMLWISILFCRMYFHALLFRCHWWREFSCIMGITLYNGLSFIYFMEKR